MASLKIGMIGAGQMATALARGFIEAGLVGPGDIVAADPAPAAAEAFAAATSAAVVASNREVAEQSDVVFLAVKPQQLAEALDSVADVLTGKHLVVSIAAGVPIARIEAQLTGAPRVIRVMPNTPCLVGQSASAFAVGESATVADSELVERFLGAVGRVFRVDEKLLDAVTGLSGSGPAFIYLVIEALSDGGVQAGLPRHVAAQLAAQTALGAAQMVLTTGEHPAELRDKVASPGGTTIAGLAALEAGGLRAALIDAVRAATERSRELGRG